MFLVQFEILHVENWTGWSFPRVGVEPTAITFTSWLCPTVLQWSRLCLMSTFLLQISMVCAHYLQNEWWYKRKYLVVPWYYRQWFVKILYILVNAALSSFQSVEMKIILKNSVESLSNPPRILLSTLLCVKLKKIYEII